MKDRTIEGYNASKATIAKGENPKVLRGQASSDLEPDSFTAGWKRACDEADDLQKIREWASRAKPGTAQATVRSVIVEVLIADAPDAAELAVRNFMERIIAMTSSIKERELTEARKDSERLDWLEKHAATSAQIHVSRYPFAAPNKDKRWMAKIEYWEFYADTWREAVDGLRGAVDAARASSTSEEESL